MITKILINDGGSRESSTERVYDEATRTWKPVSSTSTSDYSFDDGIAGILPDLDAYVSSKKPPTSENSNLSSDRTKEETEKKYREIEYCTLEGDISLVSDLDIIKIQVGDTLTLNGVGNYLSGQYYVSSVRRTINADVGYSQIITVIKTGFGDSLKKAEDVKSTNRVKEVSMPSADSFKVGDKVKVIGDDAVYSNANDGTKIPNWVKKRTLTISKLSDNGDRALLKEIVSWTYTRYLKIV